MKAAEERPSGFTMTSVEMAGDPWDKMLNRRFEKCGRHSGSSRSPSLAGMACLWRSQPNRGALPQQTVQLGRPRSPLEPVNLATAVWT